VAYARVGLDSNVSNSEIKSLLILPLLKSGTGADEIQTVLQMARVSQFKAESHEDDVDCSRETAQCPTARISLERRL
jgi:hypothetical protein